MKGRLVALSLLSFCLLMYFAYAEISFPYIIIPFIGFAISVFLWPEPKTKKKKKRYKGGGSDNDEAWDAIGYSLKALFKSKKSKQQKTDSDYFDNDIDI